MDRTLPEAENMVHGKLVQAVKVLASVALAELLALPALAESLPPEQAQPPAAAPSAPAPRPQPAVGSGPAAGAPAAPAPYGAYPAPPGAWQPMPPGYPAPYPYPYPYPYYYPYPPRGCTPDGRCWGEDLPAPPDPAEAQREAEYARQRAVRQEAREHLRFTAGGEFVIFFGDISDSSRNQPGPGIGLHVGLAKQLAPRLGLDGRFGFMYAAVGVDRCSELDYSCSSTDADQVALVNSIMMFHGEGSLLIGPFGRFYFAPGLWLGVRWFEKQSAHTENVTYNFNEAGPVGGPLGRAGFLLGSKDQVNLYGAIRGDIIKDSSVSVVGGCSLAF